MQQYARRALGFSESRVSDFMHLSHKLDALPAIREALPEIGYTKAREIVRVASEKTQERWVTEARENSRRELKAKVKKAVKRSRKKPAAELFGTQAGEPELAA